METTTKPKRGRPPVRGDTRRLTADIDAALWRRLIAATEIADASQRELVEAALTDWLLDFEDDYMLKAERGREAP